MSKIRCFLVLLAMSSWHPMMIGAEVAFGPTAGASVKRACERLKPRLGDSPGIVQVNRLKTRDEWLGDEGYTINSDKSNENTIRVEANTDAGLANGVYTMLRMVMIEDLPSPFTKRWNIRDRPYFRWRSIMVAPYGFGAAHSRDVFSPDMWTAEQWRDYLDYMRLLNLNRVYFYTMRIYDPEIAETWPNKTRYEIWKQAMDYAHELGMKFAWMQTANFVPQELWWRHPELRCKHEYGWRGCGLCYSKARDIIRKTQRHTFEYFKDADYFTLMFADGGGACYCDQCAKDQAAVFMQMVKDSQETIADVGSNAKVIFFNWLLAKWYNMHPPVSGYHERNPQLKEIQTNVFKRLPRDMIFEDIGVVPPIDLPRPDTLKMAKEKGFETVINFAWFMNLESPQFMLPRPDLQKAVDTAQYTKKAGLDGMDGYRLSPYGRILNDYAFMRLAWNPDLTPKQLIDEMAGYLTEKPHSRAKVAEAIAALDAYWTTQDRDANIAKATRLLDQAKADEPSRQLEYLADTTFMLWGIRQLQRTDISKEEKELVKERMYAESFHRYVLQGFGGTQYLWEAESRKFFNALINVWAE